MSSFYKVILSYSIIKHCDPSAYILPSVIITDTKSLLSLFTLFIFQDSYYRVFHQLLLLMQNMFFQLCNFIGIFLYLLFDVFRIFQYLVSEIPVMALQKSSASSANFNEHFYFVIFLPYFYQRYQNEHVNILLFSLYRRIVVTEKQHIHDQAQKKHIFELTTFPTRIMPFIGFSYNLHHSTLHQNYCH